MICPSVQRSHGDSGRWKNNTIKGDFETKSQPKTPFGFQEPTLLPWLTVTENLSIVCEDIGMQEHLAVFDLSEVSRLRPGQLSLGMQRRVAIARGISRDPDCCCLTSLLHHSTRQT